MKSNSSYYHPVKNYIKTIKTYIFYSITFHYLLTGQTITKACSVAVVLTCSTVPVSGSSGVQSRVSSDFFPTLRWWNESRPTTDWRWKQTVSDETYLPLWRSLAELFCFVSFLSLDQDFSKLIAKPSNKSKAYVQICLLHK